ncbi:MAG TPA: peptide chain release factor N(5)-glutamine methyltransferase [Pedobacter sp.]|nr:peptide chain release factor N(5)-glutamine methyltransferase [Pedobacter sp.]
MNFKQLLQHFKDELNEFYDPQESAAIFNVIALQVSGLDRGKLHLVQLNEVSQPELDKYIQILKELKTGKPVQYVLGETVFYGLKFKVSEAVLIPRPETEELVEWVIGTCSSNFNGRILDIGTGSGCIAVSLMKNLSLSTVFAMDISEAAIDITIHNAFLNEVVVNSIRADIRDYSSSEKFDVLVSNPPYITNDEQPEMHENVLAFEPHLALFVANENPLIFYKAIADFALTNLNAEGLLFFEINAQFGKETVEMLLAKSFIDIELRKDMQGNDRMIKCRLAG